jgi:hypothetical protein
MTPEVPSASFTPAQIVILTNEHLSEVQIDGLMSRALPIIQSYLVDRPPIAPVREAVGALRNQVDELRRRLFVAFTPRDDIVAAEAMRRIAQADYDLGRGERDEPFRYNLPLSQPGTRVEAARIALEDLTAVLDLAVGNIPAGQRRPVAAWQPIEWIHYEVPHLHPGRRAFRTVVEVCFAAAGAPPDISLDGRLRSYREQWEADRSAIPFSASD